MTNDKYTFILYVKDSTNVPENAIDVMKRKNVEVKENEFLPEDTWVVYERLEKGGLVKYLSTGDGNEYEIKAEFRQDVTNKFNSMMYEEIIYEKDSKQYISFGVLDYLNIKIPEKEWKIIGRGSHEIFRFLLQQR